MARWRKRGVQPVTVVSTAYRCTGCGEEAVHLEVWEGDDVPHGLPLHMRLCECGGGVLVRATTDGPPGGFPQGGPRWTAGGAW